MPGEILTLEVERPAVGGRMIARHDGAIVLVSGAIPGERVRARVERVQRRTIFATVVDVLEASPDRVVPPPGLACGGHVLAHVTDGRQHALKAAMIADAFRRQARIDIGTVPVTSGPPDGYRTRARLHVRGGRWGFFEPGSHSPCDLAGSRQLSADSAALADILCAGVAAAGRDVHADVEWTENATGTTRVAHVEVTGGEIVTPPGAIGGIDALSWRRAAAGAVEGLYGDPVVVDDVRSAGGVAVAVRHHVRAFFQGNRFLLQPLVDDVVRRVSGATVVDLYAGVGLFSLALAGSGRAIEAVEGEAQAAADLAANARATPGVTGHHAPVEAYLRRRAIRDVDSVVVDPPRTGLAPEVTLALAAAAVPELVYVSCDPVTLARDVRTLVDAGYTLDDVRAFDLFPRTAHVEAVVTLRPPG
jgi:tRNA/tmRNA/rRNA uracil-C5-methylase (TrmA/RlmC/RlmD family)